jgi:7-keto-8-aminopelargonate synthetase-like enzyme
MTLSLEEKKARLKALMSRKPEATTHTVSYRDSTYDMFMGSMGAAPTEATKFNEWIDSARQDTVYAFEAPRLTGARPEVMIQREGDQVLRAVNFSSYNYLGYSHHPEVIAAAKHALDVYGLGAASSPVISGTFGCHKELEAELSKFFGLEGYGVSLFSSGYAVNVGSISAFIKPGGYVVMDRSAHMSILEGAQLSRGQLLYFRHNDAAHLDEVLSQIPEKDARVLVCMEGVYSADGDYGNLADLVKVAKRHHAYTLVDEAHSMLLAGPTGRGACEHFGVLSQVDMIVMTFSKSFSGVGGALLARKDIAQYVNWYARCRMFSCALDPAVTAGMTQVLKLASSKEGQTKRDRIIKNAAQLRALLKPHVDIGVSETWIVTVHYGSEKLTLLVNDYLQRHGLDTSILQFPAVPKNESRIRLFVTSEHTPEQIEHAAKVVLQAADHFGFRRKKGEVSQ